MSLNWCVFCAREIPGDRLVCDKCRPLVDKLDRKSRRIFKREEKRIKDLAELLAKIEPLKRQSTRLTKQTLDYLQKVIEKAKKEEEEQDHDT